MDAPTTVPVEIVSRWDSTEVLFRAEVDAAIPLFGRIKAAVQIAVKARADLSGAYLSGAYLSGAYLAGADLSGADLSGADLAGADLAGADLSGAYLVGAYLAGADLSGADLSGAYLVGAYLVGAYLSGANLTGANGKTLTLTARGILTVSNIGSERGTLLAFATTEGLYVQRGCFGPSPAAEFVAAVAAKHGDNQHGRAYRAAVAMAEAWAEIAP